MQVFPSEPGTLHRVLILCALAGAVFWPDSNLAEPIKTPPTLPIEIMGAEGSVAAVTIEIPQAKSAHMVASTWTGIPGHGEFAGE